MNSPPAARPGQDALSEQASADFGAALGRLARSYETDADKQRDLLQDIMLAAAVPLNAWYARDYQRQIDELDHLRKGQS